jgi:hypothetical protein
MRTKPVLAAQDLPWLMGDVWVRVYNEDQACACSPGFTLAIVGDVWVRVYNNNQGDSFVWRYSIK